MDRLKMFSLLFALAISGFFVSLQAKEPKPEASTEPAFLVQPYLQLPTQTSIRVMWETNHKLSSRVEFGKTKSLDMVAEAPGETTLHEVPIVGLEPGRAYYYRTVSGKLTSDIYQFKTAPPLGTKRWRMAVYGDSRSNPEVHRKVAEQIAKAKVDLIVHTGDIVRSGSVHDSWRKEFFDPLGPVAHSIPWVSTIGNHEEDSANYFSYMALPGNKRYFGFDYANAHIICLDSNGWMEKDGRDRAQRQWLVEHLKEKRQATWTFVAFHHPLFSAHATRPINLLRWDWAPLFLDPENHVDGVLTGHDHFYARNYRMGRLSANPQPGVLFLTTAGGGASLYPTKKRDYVALEKKVHHFSLFDFDGDKVTLSPIDMNGNVFDRYVLTKEITPAEEFCAYDIEELRNALRRTVASAPALKAEPDKATTLDTVLRVPTRFAVPLAGEIGWQTLDHWKIKHPRRDFRLEPKQALEIPLQAEVAAGSFSKTPALTITFEAGKFRNRAIELHPFKLAGPEHISASLISQAPAIDGKLTDKCWQESPGHPLLSMHPQGGRRDRVQVLADEDRLYVSARLDDPDNLIGVKPPEVDAGQSRTTLMGEHFRVVLGDGGEPRTFAIGPDQVRYCGQGNKEDRVTEWRAVAGKETGAWCVEMAIPRRLFADQEKLRLNAIHAHRLLREFVFFELRPTYGMGSNPDVIPDWRPADEPHRLAILQIEKRAKVSKARAGSVSDD